VAAIAGCARGTEGGPAGAPDGSMGKAGRLVDCPTVSGPLPRKLLRRLGLLGYALVLAGLFAVVGYETFSLFVRRGVTPVPDVAGLERREAEARLADQGLTLRVRAGGERYDETVPAGKILQQSPPAGSLVKRGSPIEVLVSLGPELVVVPDLRGKALRAAQVTMTAAGLTLGSTASIYSTSGIPGTVVEQDPQPGSRVGRSTLMRLFLCREGLTRTFVMPDLVYRNYEEVKSFFERQGVRLGSVKFEVYEGVRSGVVLRQFPLAGHPLRQEDVISLVVATTERGA
jgi:eukaryotic-like serine/threonine-protein kinase